MLRHFFKFVTVTFFFVGCVSHTPTVEEDNVVKLSTLLHTLSPHVPSNETMQLSHDVFAKTAKLTKEFEMTSPPQYHNFSSDYWGEEKKGFVTTGLMLSITILLHRITHHLSFIWWVQI